MSWEKMVGARTQALTNKTYHIVQSVGECWIVLASSMTPQKPQCLITVSTALLNIYFGAWCTCAFVLDVTYILTYTHTDNTGDMSYGKKAGYDYCLFYCLFYLPQIGHTYSCGSETASVLTGSTSPLNTEQLPHSLLTYIYTDVFMSKNIFRNKHVSFYRSSSFIYSC